MAGYLHFTAGLEDSKKGPNSRHEAGALEVSNANLRKAVFAESKANVCAANWVEELVAAQLFVDHEAKDAHLRRAAVVKLDGALLDLGLFVEGVPAEVNEAVAEVPWELARRRAVGGVLHDARLQQANESQDLEPAHRWHFPEVVQASANFGELLAGVSDAAGETHPVGSGHVAQERKHGNAAVLDFHVPEAVKALLVGLVQEAERVPDARGRGAEVVSVLRTGVERRERRERRVVAFASLLSLLGWGRRRRCLLAKHREWRLLLSREGSSSRSRSRRHEGRSRRDGKGENDCAEHPDIERNTVVSEPRALHRTKIR